MQTRRAQTQTERQLYNFSFWFPEVALGVFLFDNFLQLLFIPVHHRVCMSNHQLITTLPEHQVNVNRCSN